MSDRQDEPACATGAVPGFFEVGTLDQVPPGGALPVFVGEATLAVVNMDGDVVAIGDLCVRCSGPLSTAALAGAELTCSKCGWRYDVKRGCVVGLPALTIEKHEVRVENGHLLIAVAALDSCEPMP